MRDVSLPHLVLWLLGSWLACGLVACLAGFLGWVFPLLALILIFPLIILVLIGYGLVSPRIFLTGGQKMLIGALVGIWLLHLTGVFVPETGFDAVWYHLPVVAAITEAHQFAYLPDLYQTLNPFFSDSLFLLGFLVGREFGAKLVAFVLGLSLLLVSYQLARQFLSRTWALILVIIVSTFQVISWQVSSFYVDIAKAMWEITAVWLLILPLKNKTNQLLSSGIFLGASLATKLFSILLLPVFGVMMYILDRKNWLKFWLLFVTASLLVVLPFAIRTYHFTGSPWLSAELYLSMLGEIGGAASPITYVLERTMRLPFLPFTLTVGIRDYVTILFLVCLPLVLLGWRKLSSDNRLLTVLVFSLGQLMLWWFVPPLSTRYALAGFITLAIVYCVAIEDWLKKQPSYTYALALTVLLAVTINLVPRIAVGYRNLKYMYHQPPLTEYVSQFYDGSIDSHLQKWYQLSN